MLSVQRPLFSLCLPVLVLCALACGGGEETDTVEESSGASAPPEVPVPSASHAVAAPMLWFASFGTPGGAEGQTDAAVEACGSSGDFPSGNHGYAVMEVTRARVRLGDATVMSLVGGRPLAGDVDQGLVVPLEGALEAMTAANQAVRDAGCTWQPLGRDTLLVSAGKNLPSSTVEMLTGTAQAMGWATLLHVDSSSPDAQPMQLAGAGANAWRLQLSFAGDSVVAEELGPMEDYQAQLGKAPPTIAELSVDEGVSWGDVASSVDSLYGAGVPCVTLMPTGEQLPDLDAPELESEGTRARSASDKVAVLELSAYPWEDAEDGEWALVHGLQCRWPGEAMSDAVLRDLGLKKSSTPKPPRATRTTRRPPQPSNTTRVKPSTEPRVVAEPTKTAPLGKPTVRPTGLKLDRGDEAAVNSVLRAGLPRVKSCYEIGLRDDPTIAGSMILEVDVEKRSGAGNVQVRRGLDRAIDRCVQKELSKLVYPSDRKEYVVTWNLSFSLE